jgi:pimeloyl-ACP methyl ester carboxylesterase
MNSIGLRDITVVGHDVGGQVAYAYLREYAREINGAVIMTS